MPMPPFGHLVMCIFLCRRGVVGRGNRFEDEELPREIIERLKREKIIILDELNTPYRAADCQYAALSKF